MENTLTIKEAIEQGYEYYLYADTEWQTLKSIEDAKHEFLQMNHPIIFLASKEVKHPIGLSNEEIKETLADIISENYAHDTGCDTDEVYDLIKSLDFEDVIERIDTALQSINYRIESNIRLTP